LLIFPQRTLILRVKPRAGAKLAPCDLRYR
jgi:hypothetical protein